MDTGEPTAPPVRETRAIPTLDALAAGLDPAISGQLPLALQLFEWGPLLFDLRFTRFTRMSAAEQDASLEGWMTSRLGLRRMGFTALRNLAFLGYYSQDETWALIGYAGPAAGRSPLRRGAAPRMIESLLGARRAISRALARRCA